jgi:hypothetical protein
VSYGREIYPISPGIVTLRTLHGGTITPPPQSVTIHSLPARDKNGEVVLGENRQLIVVYTDHMGERCGHKLHPNYTFHRG